MATQSLVYLVCCCGLLYFLCQVQLSECEVTLVTRNVTDSFRIGEGCKTNESICTSVQATCQDDGLCLCTEQYPNFRNPVITTKLTSGYSSQVVYGESYGCITNEIIVETVDKNILACTFKPYQVIPNDRREQATKFEQKGTTPDEIAEKCRFIDLDAKYPNNNSLTKITWLNQTYVELNILNGTLNFKWKKSVSKLQGLIIKMYLRCKLKVGYGNECLEGKIFGTWRLPVISTSPTPTIISTFSSTMEKSTSLVLTSHTNLPEKTTPLSHLPSIPSMEHFSTETFNSSTRQTPTASSTNIASSSRSEVCNKPGFPKAVAVSVFIVLSVIILLLILGLLVLYRRQKRNEAGRPNDTEMKGGEPTNPVYEYPSPQYAGLENCGRDNDEKHVYQGLVGVSKDGKNTQSSNLEIENSDVGNSTKSVYDDPSHNYEPLKANTANVADEHVYQGLVGVLKEGNN